MANCNYKVNIKDIQNKYKFKIFSAPRGEKGETGETGAIGTPLVATSTSQMTDTTRNYINTTDGHWYYYNGTSWEDGGAYQSTGIADGSVTPAKTDFAIRNTTNTDGETTRITYTLSSQDYWCNTSTGVIEQLSTPAHYKYTSPIEVNNVDRFFQKGIKSIVFFDDNNNYVSRIVFNDNDVVNGTNIQVPSNAKTFIGNITKIFWDGTYTNYVEKTEIIVTNTIYIDELKITDKNIDDNLNTIYKFKNKKIVCLGDSITGTYNTLPRSYVERLKELCNFQNVYNCGFGGCMMGTHPSSYYAPFGFAELSDAISTGDFSNQEAQIGQTSDQPNYRTNLTTLENVDFSTLDYLTVFYGTNDYYYGRAYDNENNPYDKTTFAGALRYGLDKIMTAYPNINIILIEPIYRWFGADSDSDNYKGGALQIELPKYIEIINDVAKEFKIPVVKMYYELGFNKYNKLIYFNSNDGTHPNAKGMDRIAEKISDTIVNNY